MAAPLTLETANLVPHGLELRIARLASFRAAVVLGHMGCFMYSRNTLRTYPTHRVNFLTWMRRYGLWMYLWHKMTKSRRKHNNSFANLHKLKMTKVQKTK